jgi:hypothetical protein
MFSKKDTPGQPFPGRLSARTPTADYKNIEGATSDCDANGVTSDRVDSLSRLELPRPAGADEETSGMVSRIMAGGTGYFMRGGSYFVGCRF